MVQLVLNVHVLSKPGDQPESNVPPGTGGETGSQEPPSPSPPSAQTPPPVHPAPCAHGFAGSWDDGWDLIIDASGNGTYSYNEQRTGVINGTVVGNTLTGTWNNNPNEKDSHQGKFTFTLSDDGQSFTGKFGYGDDEQSSGWDGTRKK